MVINSKELRVLAECAKKYELQKLSLKSKNRRYILFNEVISQMCSGLAEGLGKGEICLRIRQFLEQNYQEQWFLLSWQKNAAIERDIQLFIRFLENFHRQETEKMTSTVIYQVPFQHCCMDREITSVGTKADLLIEHGREKVTGIIICRKFPKPYSYRASKAENKVINNVELLFLMAALKERYPERGIEVQMISLVSKTDGQELSRFEAKRGDNVISFSAEQLNNGLDLQQRLKEAITCIKPSACKDCRYQEMCRPALNVYLKQTQEIPSSQPKSGILTFSEEQRNVICHKLGPARVCAGPGSGKTASMVARMEGLLSNGVAPKKILAVTFSKKAAEEITERIQWIEKPRISTLHACAFEILGRYEFLIGRIKLVGKVDSMQLLLKILEFAPKINASYEGLTLPYGLVSTLIRDFDFIRRNGAEKFIESYPKKDTAGILLIKSIYDDMFRREGFVVYDDLIPKAVDLIKAYQSVQEVIMRETDFIIVDEAQDLDEKQMEFVTLLCAEKRNLMICGDADQSIYQFRGGSNYFMVHFKELFPDASDYKLGQNHRSTKEIVDAATALIEQNQERIPIKLSSDKSYKKPVYIEKYHEEKLGILLRDLIDKGFRFSDIAVIARKNQDLLKICDRMGKEIPMERPKHFLRDDYVFNGLLYLLTLWVAGPDEDETLYCLLEMMGYQPEKNNRNLSLYQDLLQQKLIWPFDSEESSCYYLELEQEQQVRQLFARIYRSMQHFYKPLKQGMLDAIGEFFDARIETSEVEKWLADAIEERRMETPEELYQLMNAMKVFQDDTRIYYPVSQNHVHMLTAHDSKGKEFPVVILIGLEEYERGDIEEDRRLLYVAMTRAKKMLFLAENYMGGSMLIKEIVEKIDIYRGCRYE